MATWIKPGIYTQQVDYSYEWDSEPSYSPSSVSDSQIAQDYADLLADRLQKDNLDEIDKNHIAGMIYAILMQEDIPQKTRDRLVDERPDKEQLFKDEEFEI